VRTGDARDSVLCMWDVGCVTEVVVILDGRDGRLLDVTGCPRSPSDFSMPLDDLGPRPCLDKTAKVVLFLFNKAKSTRGLFIMNR
jgi:hypothetical protein